MRPDDISPQDWAPLPSAEREVLYERWKLDKPEQAQKALETVAKNIAKGSYHKESKRLRSEGSKYLLWDRIDVTNVFRLCLNRQRIFTNTGVVRPPNGSNACDGLPLGFWTSPKLLGIEG